MLKRLLGQVSLPVLEVEMSSFDWQCHSQQDAANMETEKPRSVEDDKIEG